MKKLLQLFSMILAFSLVCSPISLSAYADDGTGSSEKENVSYGTVWFGSFYQNEETNENTIEALSKTTLNDGVAVLNGKRYAYKNKRYYKESPIQWRIIEEDGTCLTLMSEKLLDMKALGTDVTSDNDFWDTCTLRSWLNNDFYNTAFSETDKANIVPSNVTFFKRTYDQWRLKEKGEDVTVVDNVYILRGSEVVDGMYCFTDNSSRVANTTAYAGTEGAASDWWLCGDGFWQYGNLKSAYVSNSGSITDYYPTYSKGVRPVIKVQKDADGLSFEEPYEEEEIIFTRFELGRDNNSYIHDYADKPHSGFLGVVNHDMGPAYKAALARESDLGGTAVSLIISKFPSNGWCYGIAATIALVHEGYLSVSDITSDTATTYFDMSPPALNVKLKNTINYYFESQNRIKEQIGYYATIPPGIIHGSQINISEAALDYRDFLKKMVQAAQVEDLIFAVPGHAILITDCAKNSDGTYTLQVYDENSVWDDAPYGEFGEIHIDLSRFQMEYVNYAGNVALSTEQSENSQLYFSTTTALANASKEGIKTAKARSIITIPRYKPVKIKSSSGKDLISVTKDAIEAYNTPIYDLIPFLNDVAGEEHDKNDEMIQVEIDKVDGIIVECESDEDLEVGIRDSENAAQIKGKFNKLTLDMGDSINVEGDIKDYFVGMSSNKTTDNGDKAIITMTGSSIKNLKITADQSSTTFDMDSSDASDDTTVSIYDGSEFKEIDYSDKEDPATPPEPTPEPTPAPAPVDPTPVDPQPAPIVTPTIPTTPAEIVDLPTVKITKPKAAKKKTTVKWKKVSKKNLKKISGIQIQVATDPAFTNIVKTATVGKKKTSKTIKGLQSKTKYYVRIRAYSAGNHVSNWKSKSVKVK